MKCRNPECTAEVNHDALFCGKCGTPVLSVCPICNSSIPAKTNTKYCVRCGTMITEMKSKTGPKVEDSVMPETNPPTSRRRSIPSSTGMTKAGPVDSSLHLRAEPEYYGTDRSVTTMSTSRPVDQIKTNRSLGMFILLSIVTFGIYPIVFFSKVGTDLNKIASRYDGKKTMHFCLMFFIVAPITLGIGFLVWYHKMSDRVGSELRRRGYEKTMGSDTYWLWAILGSLLLGIGPFIYIYKLSGAMNTLAEDYNAYG